MNQNSNLESIELRTASFHECGHLIMAYIHDYKVNHICILLNDDKTIRYAKTNYNFGHHSDLAASLEDDNIENTILNFRNFKTENQNALIEFGYVKLKLLIGGSIAETLYIHNRSISSTTPFELRGPDSKKVYQIEEFLKHFNRRNHNDNQLNLDVQNTFTILNSDVIWNFIVKLSDELLSSSDLKLNNCDIEKILEENGFFQWLAAI